ncbi:hypothetical protein CDD83_10183 [Cordyceps sp. RAO-2017]|nr:hypothetical protein CDD83_10183 [Cordyceps sp. RAO-2017]
MAPIDDSMPARISPDCPQATRDILYHAWAHDLPGLKTLLGARKRASAQDPRTGETALHAAIRACGPAARGADDADDDGCVDEAKHVLDELFLSGAIWNDVDGNGETPGCVARRLGRQTLYRTCLEAGLRAELLFALMDGYQELSSGPGSEAEPDGAREEGGGGGGVGGDDAMDVDAAAAAAVDSPPGEAETAAAPDAGGKPVTSRAYLGSSLTLDADKLLDADRNGVMMRWETDIMRRSVAALVPDAQPGKRILNIGFGMGIVDGLFAQLRPSRHHIVEAHPDVLDHVAGPASGFGPDWEARGPEPGAYKVHAGRWQDVVPQLLDRGEVYDAVYFDTFGEDYGQLRMFFTEYIPGLLDHHGRFSFFNGLGADRRICYDVYTKVVEVHCADAGLDVDWIESAVDMAGLDEEGQGQWEGVRRRYWTLDTYRLPVCSFMG